ncbi:hypothetical protein Focb16_v005567 [Fusarium oxysporum f. sp. cubense]|uniref:Uncharacterized protein n=1 Tax=Fusarium oxysporum f. sp. cubense TaxID=61366 RepID=A0A559LLH9_FUSOC|nr:hypothetical protein Focb16_v005567 [Fusarium oxysporum f. sp. cubense]
METYSLKDCFLRVGFYKVTQKLVGQVSEWKSDITQFICDALEKHAGTSKNKDSANDDHPTSKRSRSEGAIDGTASPLQKRAKTVADSHTEVPTAANTGRCLQEHQTPNIGPLTSSPSVTQDRVLRTPFSGTFRLVVTETYFKTGLQSWQKTSLKIGLSVFQETQMSIASSVTKVYIMWARNGVKSKTEQDYLFTKTAQHF